MLRLVESLTVRVSSILACRVCDHLTATGQHSFWHVACYTHAPIEIPGTPITIDRSPGEYGYRLTSTDPAALRKALADVGAVEFDAAWRFKVGFYVSDDLPVFTVR